MIIFKSINKLNKEVNFKASIGFVPTMGSLHKGHISLVKNCQKTCNKTLVSIFINPSQFNRKTDYKNYPRTLDRDIKILKKLKVDYVLVPNIKEIYSRNTPRKISINKKHLFILKLILSIFPAREYPLAENDFFFEYHTTQ